MLPATISLPGKAPEVNLISRQLIGKICLLISLQTVLTNAAAFLGHKLASEKTIRNLARKTVVKKEATVANISAEVSDPVIVHESQVFQYCAWKFSVVCERFLVLYWSLYFISSNTMFVGVGLVSKSVSLACVSNSRLPINYGLCVCRGQQNK